MNNLKIFLDLFGSEAISKSFDYHRSHPEITVGQHYLGKVVSTGQEIWNVKKIYLDTKYWIFLRDVFLGNARNPIHAKIYELLLDLVEKRKLICPISEDTFLELLKNKNKAKRLAGATVIDILSKGIAIQPYNARSATELNYVLYESPARRYCLHPLERLVWVKAAYVLGYVDPIPIAFPKEEQQVIRKAWTDFMWDVPLSALIDTDVLDASSFLHKKSMLADIHNAIKQEESPTKLTFERAFLLELADILKYYEPEMLRMIRDKYQRETGQILTERELKDESFAKHFSNIIYEGFRRKTLTTNFPSLSIPARIYAALSIDYPRKYKPNDIYDINHATAALPYCDMFFTDNPFRHLVTSNPLKLDSMYSTEVVSDEEDALKLLEGLCSTE